MSETVNIALLQMTSTNQVTDNLDYIERELAQHDLSAVDILVLPEMFAQFGEAEASVFHESPAAARTLCNIAMATLLSPSSS